MEIWLFLACLLQFWPRLMITCFYLNWSNNFIDISITYLLSVYHSVYALNNFDNYHIQMQQFIYGFLNHLFVDIISLIMFIYTDWCIAVLAKLVQVGIFLHSKYLLEKMCKILKQLLCKNLSMPKIGKLLSLSFCTCACFFIHCAHLS